MIAVPLLITGAILFVAGIAGWMVAVDLQMAPWVEALAVVLAAVGITTIITSVWIGAFTQGWFA